MSKKLPAAYLFAAVAAVAVLVLTIYLPAFQGGLYLDSKTYLADYHKYQPGRSLPEALSRALTQGYHPADRRLLTNVTFALQTYGSGADAGRLRAANAMIHLANLLLAFTLFGIISRRLLPDMASGTRRAAAGAAALLWGVNPYQVEAVAYAVQRGTLLVTTFCLIAAIAFLQIIDRPFSRSRWWLYIVFTLSLAGAALSKENAVLIPLLLLCLTLPAWAGRGGKPDQRKLWLLAGMSGLFIFLIMTMARPVDISPASGYQERPFTMMQRLLTEPRVLVHQLGLFLVPYPGWLSIKPFYAISRDLLHPITTLPAIAVMAAAAVWAWLLRRRAPLVAVAVLWFLVGHLLESTVFPLEIAFPHRNYLPTLFLYLPAAVWVSTRQSGFSRATRAVTLGLAATTLALFSAGTYIHAGDWSSPERFWVSNINASPRSLLPYVALSGHYLESNRPQQALEVVNLAFTRGSFENDLPRRRTNLIVNRGLARAATGNYTGALEDMGEAVAADPANLDYLYNHAVISTRAGYPSVGFEELERVRKADPTYPDVHLQMALILIGNGRSGEALPYLEQELRNFPGNSYAMRLKSQLSVR